MSLRRPPFYINLKKVLRWEMVELEIKLNARQNVVHIPRLITNSMHSRHFKIILDSQVAILYPSNVTVEDVLPNLHLLLQQLELRVEQQARTEKA